MPRIRVPISGVMAFVAVFAIGTAALAGASAAWEAIVSAVALMALLLAPLGWAFRRGRARAAFAGFAVCGWGYLLIGQIPWPASFPNLAGAADSLIRIAGQRAHPGPGLGSPDIPPGSTLAGKKNLYDQRMKSRNDYNRWQRLTIGPFVSIGHSLLTLSLGFLGALLTTAFIATNSQPEDAARSHD